MEVVDFYEVLFNPVAQAKFVHTVSAGYVTASIFVLGVSAWYALKGRHIEIAKRSMTVAASFGLASALSVVVLGDESGYLSGEHQKMKLAAIEAMWETEPAPAAFTVFGISRYRGARNALCRPRALGHGSDRYAVADHRNSGHQGIGGSRQDQYPQRVACLRCAPADPRRGQHAPLSARRCATPLKQMAPTWAMRCC